MKAGFFHIVVLALSMSIAGQVLADPVIPNTPAGQRASAYLAAFNTGDQARMQAFELEHRAASSLRRRSMEERLVSYRKSFSEWGTVRVMRVVDGGALGVLVAVQAEKSGDWYDLAFELESDPPNKLLGIRVAGPLDPKAGSVGEKPVDQKMKERVVDRVAEELVRAYVFEDVAQQMAKYIRNRLAEGEYNDLHTAYSFAQRLTTDLRGICHDLHLRVRPRVPRRRGGPSPGFGGRRAPDNHSFVKVEVLPGNVGYIKLNGFSGDPAGEGPAAAAMAFVADTDALIFDLRENGGGSPDMICFISGYLFDEPVHLNTFDDRLAGISHTYSREDVPGKHYGQEKPVYVLTSSHTFSAAEEFTYNLKHLKRATIVGQATGGGAHPVTGYTINKYFDMSVPYARAVNPVTKTNWEGVGVIPHVEVPVDQALDKAHQLALEGSKQAH